MARSVSTVMTHLMQCQITFALSRYDAIPGLCSVRRVAVRLVRVAERVRVREIDDDEGRRHTRGRSQPDSVSLGLNRRGRRRLDTVGIIEPDRGACPRSATGGMPRPPARVSLQQGVDLGFQGPSLFVDGGQRAGRRRDHDVQGARAGDDDGLFVECVEDLVDQPGGHARGLGPDDFDESAAAGSPRRGRGAVAFQRPRHGGVDDEWTIHRDNSSSRRGPNVQRA